MNAGELDRHQAPRLVVVLGMHRSGTSVTARALRVLGADLGDNLLKQNQNNELGYWEDADIQALNAEMLRAIGSEWYHLTPISQSQADTLCALGYRDRAWDMLRRKMSGKEVCGLKDPRITKLLPFWDRIFDNHLIETSYVLAIRDPMSVAASLAKRNDFTPTQSLMLWLGYNIAALEVGGAKIRAVTDYDQLIKRPRERLQSLAAQLGLSFDPAAMETFETEFLDAGLNHSASSLADVPIENPLFVWVHEVSTVLQQLSVGELRTDDSHVRERISSWVDIMQKLRPLTEHADTLHRQIERALRPTVAQRLAHFGRSAFRKGALSGWIKRRFRG